MKLQNKVAIITGAAQGMGATHARKFVEEGAKVVITDINLEAAQTLADELGENAIALKHDVSKADNWSWYFQTFRRAYRKRFQINI